MIRRRRVAAPGDWHAQLDAAIADLEQTVAPQPTTVAELHDHMRLRTLQLLAGNETDAYRPIPGASPAQQDFWSKQLFAINAYLNATTQLDEKQRHRRPAGPLDEARAPASRNSHRCGFATCRSSNRSTASAPTSRAKGPTFTPGQKVMLYAEVENFASNASEKRVRDFARHQLQSARRVDRLVDGKQFPDV